MNAVRQLDSGNGDRRIVERREPGHRGTAPSDRAMHQPLLSGWR
jgi:hypothetical protein